MLRKIFRRLFSFIINIIKYMPFEPMLKLRNICYRVVLKKMGKHSNICDAVTIVNPSMVSIGDHVSIHEFTVIGGKGAVTIGDYVAIASHCQIVSDAHNFSEKDVPIKRQGVTAKDVIIGNNVWFGSHVTILGGVKIGDGAVIGAGAVVTKDVPENAIAMGVPATVRKFR